MTTYSMKEIDFTVEKEKLQGLRKEQSLMASEYQLYKARLKDYKNLQFRSTCPCCQQDTNREYYRDLIPITEDRIVVLDEKLHSIYTKIQTLQKPISEERYKFEKEREVLCKAYLLKNRNRINKTIRDYNNGVENYMPYICFTDEKKLWNNAMEIQLANKPDMDDTNDELMFEI